MITERVQPARSGILRERIFATVYTAETVSILGSQLAKFALSVLVFDRTDSASAAALTYATSFVPAAVGGFVLGRLGDRFARRSVMVGADLLRGLLFVLMALPGVPLPVVIVLLALAVLFDPVFSAAEVSLLADALDPEQFRAGTAVRTASAQVTQVLGFAVGGAVVAWLHPRGALVLDAATFAVSALLVGVLVREPTRGRHRAPDVEAATDDSGFAGLWRDRRTRGPMVFTVLIGLFVLPEALAVPFGASIGATTTQTGLLVASIPLGAALGSVLVVRVPDRWRAPVASAMAVGAGLPLAISAAEPAWPLAAAGWAVSGLLTAYEVEAISRLVRAIPAAVRATMMARVSAWLVGSQGLAFGAGAALAGVLAPGTTIMVAALTGSAVAAVMVLTGTA